MIRFNGYPFLEKEDHAFGVSVAKVMKKDLHTLFVSGMRVRDLEDILERTDIKGFPIVSADATKTLMGYIGRAELRYVLDNAKKLGDISDDAACSFLRDAETDHGVAGLSDSASGPAIGIEEELARELINTTLSSDILKLWPWVNLVGHFDQCWRILLLKVPPVDSSDSVAGAPIRNRHATVQKDGVRRSSTIFSTCANGCSLSHRRPRVILVEDHGILVGLVTVKDVLKFTAIEKPDGDASWDELRGGLEGLLEEVYTWTMMVVERLVSWYRRLFRG